MDRDLVTEPLNTGVTVIDAMFPLGRGQRELIIGDRSTGKTAIAVDTIINQRSSDVISVYIAVGQKSSNVRQVIEAVREHGAFDRCIFVVAAADDPPGLQWLAPYAGFTIAEHFRDRGDHALAVIDDLSKHAATHRELSLLLRQPPGREAFPGDIFYVHSRLLERAAKLSKERGGGSLSALPIATHPGGQSKRLYSNQPDFDHRRPDLPRQDAVQSGAQAGGRCRAQRLARGRQDPDARHAQTGRKPASRLRPVSRT